MGGSAEKNVYFLLAAGLPAEKRERKGHADGNDKPPHPPLPAGRVTAGGGERPELCGETLRVGGNIRILYQMYRNPTFLNSSKLGSSYSYFKNK